MINIVKQKALDVFIYTYLMYVLMQQCHALSKMKSSSIHTCTSVTFREMIPACMLHGLSSCMLRTVKARGLVFCSQQSYQLVSANYMIVNMISRTRAPHLPYTLYREGQAIGRVNKEAVCRSTKQPREGKPRVSVKSTKVTEPPDDLLERVNVERRCYRRF